MRDVGDRTSLGQQPFFETAARDRLLFGRAAQGRRDHRLDRQERERAAIDRMWAAADRDAALSDRADLDAIREAGVERDNT